MTVYITRKKGEFGGAFEAVKARVRDILQLKSLPWDKPFSESLVMKQKVSGRFFCSPHESKGDKNKN